MAYPTLLAAILATTLVAPAATAAEQGTLGTQSKGEVTITLTIAQRVTMSNVAAAQPSDGDAQRACLWLDTATQGYAVTALGAPVAWRRSAMAAAGTPVAAGATLANLSSASSHPDCGRDPALFVAYDALGGAAARPATVLIAPE